MAIPLATTIEVYRGMHTHTQREKERERKREKEEIGGNFTIYCSIVLQSIHVTFIVPL